MPLRQGYGITDNIMPTPEGLFLVSGTPYGDDAGLALHRIAPGGVVKEFFHTNGNVWAEASWGNAIYLVETPKGKKSARLLIKIERASLAKSKHQLQWGDEWDDAKYAVSGDRLLALSRDERTLRSIALDSPDQGLGNTRCLRRKISAPLRYGCRAGLRGTDAAEQTNGFHSHLLIELATGQWKEKSANQYEARVWLLHSGGKTFGVLSD